MSESVVNADPADADQHFRSLCPAVFELDAPTMGPPDLRGNMAPFPQ